MATAPKRQDEVGFGRMTWELLEDLVLLLFYKLPWWMRYPLRLFYRFVTILQKEIMHASWKTFATGLIFAGELVLFVLVFHRIYQLVDNSSLPLQISLWCTTLGVHLLGEKIDSFVPQKWAIWELDNLLEAILAGYMLGLISIFGAFFL